MSNNRKFPKTTLSTAVAAALAPGAGALAQDQEQADSDRVLEEVIVTATLRKASMQDLPQSLQAFTSDDIIRNAFSSFTDVANAIPSLSLITTQPGRNSVKFRGISTGTGEYYTGSTSAIYFDETPLTFNSQQLWPAMVDIERIEALPGPQGTLFGSSSLAGTVRVVTNKPDPSAMYGEVFGEYFDTKGGDGSYALNGWINIPLIDDTLALRVVGHTRDEGGWIDNVFGETFVQPDDRFIAAGNNADLVEDNYNEYKLSGGRASLLWNVDDNWEVIVALISERNESEGSWGDDTNLPDYQHAYFHKENRDDEWWNASLLIEGDLGFATLTSSTTYLDRDITYEFENMVYEQYKDGYFGNYLGYGIYNSEYTYGWIFNDQTQDRVSQELRLTSDTDSRFSWMVGAFYEKINDKWLYGATNPDLMDTQAWATANAYAYFQAYYQGYDVAYPLAPTTLPYTNRLDRTDEQLAFFGEVTFEITEKWWVTGGARWFQFKQDFFDQNQFPEGLPPPNSGESRGVVRSVSKDSDTVYKLSTQYFFNDDVMAYALFSQGFRLGGDNSERAARTGLIPAQYEPDFLDNYEIGAKTSWFDNSLVFNINFFLLEWNDRQFNEGGVDGQWWLRGTVNGGDTETKGVEASFVWQATDNLQLQGNVTRLEGEAKTFYEFLNGDVIRPGDPLPNAPELSWWASAEYTFPMEVMGGEMWIYADYSYGDEWWNSTDAAIQRDPEGLIPDWNTTNLQLGLSLPNDWTITAFVRNLTDERIVNGRQDNSYASDFFGVPDYRTIEWVSRPRHYGLSVRKGFY